MNYTTLVSAKTTLDNINNPNWRIIDCQYDLKDESSGFVSYKTGHIPSAIYADLKTDLSSPVSDNTGRHPLPTPNEICQKLGSWGISSETQVVVYDDAYGSFAARLWWLLNWLGHDNVAVLNGGLRYWKQQNYLGLGPSAHSFNGNSRQWNISDNEEYIRTINRNETPCKKEILDEKTRYNEYILTSLRTMWGADLKYIEETFSKEASDYCVSLSNRFIDYGMLERNGEFLVLTHQGKFISDNIISELLMVN